MSFDRRMRLRASKHLRDLSNDTDFSRAKLIQPLFVGEGLKEDLAIPGLRGTARQSIEGVVRQVEKDLEAGVSQFLLFEVPAKKSERDFDLAFSEKAIHAIKARFGKDLFLWVDTCLCSLTTHGHCCVFNDQGKIDLDETLPEIARLAAHYAGAGADGIAPSDMMDGRVAAIREELDDGGFDETPIMSYSTKFASNLYGPFRVAADSSPKHGDRKGYQIDVRNRLDAIESSIRCANEGADLLMVKPGMTSIDLIREIEEKTGKRVGAYQVSGEFASLVLLSENGLTKFEDAVQESWHVFRRAGAAFIITYGARFAKAWGYPS